MSVFPEDLMAPKGKLDPAMYPELDQADIDEILQAYIDEGETKVTDLDADDQDGATTAWAYHRAFEARAIQLASIPTSTQLPNEVATTRTDGQRTYFQQLADYWLAQFDAMFPVDEGDVGGLFPGTGSTINQYHW